MIRGAGDACWGGDPRTKPASVGVGQLGLAGYEPPQLQVLLRWCAPIPNLYWGCTDLLTCRDHSGGNAALLQQHSSCKVYGSAVDAIPELTQ